MVLLRLAANVLPVESFGHEVRSAIFFQQTARRHEDTGLLGHEVIGVLDAPVTLPRAQLLVLSHTIEFQQPVFKSGRGVELPTANLIRLRIPGDDGLCARRPRTYLL
jgi:hypothetical protein